MGITMYFGGLYLLGGSELLALHKVCKLMVNLKSNTCKLTATIETFLARVKQAS